MISKKSYTSDGRRIEYIDVSKMSLKEAQKLIDEIRKKLLKKEK